MSGEWLLGKLNAKGGHINDYADVMYGKVVKDSPLSIQLSDKITLTTPFLILGRNVTDHKEKIILDGETKEIIVKQSLKTDDKVAMIRLDGGQEFYIFEKLSDQQEE